MPDSGMKENQFHQESSFEAMSKYGAVTPSDLTRIGAEVKMQINPDEDPNDRERRESEAFYANQAQLEMYGRRDRLLNRLMNAETVADVAAAQEALYNMQDWSKADASDPYTFRQFIKTALDGAEGFSKMGADLISEGLIEGSIDADGYLSEGSIVRQKGYAIRVDQRLDQTPVSSIKRTYTLNEKGERVLQGETEEVVFSRQIKERVYFGSDKERTALANAHDQLMKILITSQKIHQLTGLFDNNRAALDQLVKQHYLGQAGLTNAQIKWVFTAADIGKITPEKPMNEELGLRKSKAMRLNYLLGMCETKEKMEAHLNDTLNFEKIFDKETINRTLTLMKKLKFEDSIADQLNLSEIERVARFVIGKNVTKGEDEKWKVAGWLTADQRDPSKATDESEKDKRGINAVKQEKDVRGFLTEYGNPYTRGSRDIVYQLENRMSMIIGDKNAVRDAGRLFWTWGERDELGLEIYSPNALPTGENLLDTFNELSLQSNEKWQEWAQERLRYFSLPGEPVGSDLSKIFYPQFYRLKDLLNDRPTGSHLTYDKFDRFTQSLMNLSRTDVKVGGKVQTRSVREQFLGHKATDGLPVEEAKELGEIGWEQVSVPPEIEDALIGEKNVKVEFDDNKTTDALKLDGGSAADNAYGYFWLMNFLAGDDALKRPWASINDESPDPRSFMKAATWTGKNKFMTIVWHDPALVYGDWRKQYIKAEALEVSVSSLNKKIAREKWKMGRKEYWRGVMALPDYPTWASMEMKAREESGNVIQTNVLEIIEGKESMPGMAARFGFMDREKATTRLQEHRFKILEKIK